MVIRGAGEGEVKGPLAGVSPARRCAGGTLGLVSHLTVSRAVGAGVLWMWLLHSIDWGSPRGGARSPTPGPGLARTARKCTSDRDVSVCGNVERRPASATDCGPSRGRVGSQVLSCKRR